MTLDPRAVACALGGDASGRNVLGPGPGPSRVDQSLWINVEPHRPGSPRLDRLGQLLGNDISFERVWHELSSRRGRAAASTVEAIVCALRERGIAALTERKIRSWLSDCDDRQVAEIGDRLQKLKPEVLRLGKGKLHRGWTVEEVEGLLQTWSVLR